MTALRRVRNGRLDKVVETLEEAVADIADGATILVGGFGECGVPFALTRALVAQGAKELTIVSNNAGSGDTGVAALLKAGRVAKIVCSFPRTAGSTVFEEMYHAGKIELELVPQGTLSERIRAGGAGIGGFFTPTGAGTQLADGKETRMLDGRLQVFERPIHADFALIHCDKADRWGNLTYRKTMRSFGPVMAPAARVTIVEARRIVELGEIDPETVVTPGIFVQRVVDANAER